MRGPGVRCCRHSPRSAAARRCLPCKRAGNTVKAIFWVCAFLIAYTYVVYPVSIALLAGWRGSRRAPQPAPPSRWPTVSVILCARDESPCIETRLANLCSQCYEPGSLEIIVVSDGSTDDTAAVVGKFRQSIETPRITLIEKTASEGKAAGLNDAVAASSGQVLVMADARQQFGRDEGDTETIRRLVISLSAPGVGCVSGELVFVDTNRGMLQSDLGMYWRYEKWIRRNESGVDSVPGVTGAIYAMKKELFEPIPAATLLDDVLIPLRVILQGHRVIFDDGAVARDRASASAAQEWRRKVRTLAGNWQLLTLIPAAFVPTRNRIWLQFISHKILRLLVPFMLIAILVSTTLVPSPAYRTMLWLQLILYFCAALPAVIPAAQRSRLLGVSHTFVMLNLAAVAGLWFWITGRTAAVWGRPPRFKESGQ